ncbi:MAG: Hsp20/alpha crystallin family protein [Candidatus Woesearchaeota archaeon]
MWEDNFWNEMKRVRKKMNQAFGQSDFPKRVCECEPDNYRQAWADFMEDENSFKIAVEIPGVNKEDIHLEVLEDNTLIIKAEKKQEKEEKSEEDDEMTYQYKYSKSYSGFYRSVTLPETADSENINAEYKDGILKIVVPKKKSSKKKKQINVR